MKRIIEYFKEQNRMVETEKTVHGLDKNTRRSRTKKVFNWIAFIIYYGIGLGSLIKNNMKRIIEYFKEQDRMVEMAKRTVQELDKNKKQSRTESVFSWIAFIIFYGVSIGFGLYMIYQIIIY